MYFNVVTSTLYHYIFEALFDLFNLPSKTDLSVKTVDNWFQILIIIAIDGSHEANIIKQTDFRTLKSRIYLGIRYIPTFG